MYKIYTDSTVDLPGEYIKKLNIEVMTLGYSIAGSYYKNELINPEFTPHEFYELVKNGNEAKTFHIYESDIIDSFKKTLDNNLDILYIAFSSELSGTYKSALIAKRILEQDYPERKIYVIDSRSASMGEGLLVYLACKKRDEGLSIDELYDWVQANKLKIWHWFTVDDINHLKRGGRLTASQAFLAKSLKIKPVLYVDGLGRLVKKSLVLGRKRAINLMIEKMKDNYCENTPIFISHADTISDAIYLKNLIKKELNVDDVIISYVGPVIGTHSGFGTLALFYMGNVARIVE